MAITSARRTELAASLGISDAYLYQCLTGRKAMKPEEAVRLEARSSGELMRWHLRPADWFLIWPELIGTKGAPAVPTERAGA